MGARYAALTATLAAMIVAAAIVPVARAEEGATITALQLAAARENNAQWHYEAYMMQARREGQPRAANVFRAAATGEAIHLANHLRELERLGGTVELTIESIVVRSTEENLAAAIAVEARERDQVYRQFGDFARRECLYEALATFNYARGAEATHLEFFQKELERVRAERPENQMLACAFQDPLLALGTGIPGATTFVCGGCGRLFEARPEKSCPLCGTAGTDAYEVH